MKIIPAILPQSFRAIELNAAKVNDVVDTVQLDFVDGTFANNRTWLFNNKDQERVSAILREEEGLPFWDTLNYEFDLMVANPLEHMDTFIALGPSKLIFHVESLDEESMITYFEQLPEIVRMTITFGIALNVDTDPALLTPYIPYVDTVQCMGIAKPGFQGQPFDERVIEQIKKVRALYPEKIISVDGSVNLETAPLLAEAGAKVLVVGSALFQNVDIHGTISAFKRACKTITTPSEN